MSAVATAGAATGAGHQAEQSGAIGNALVTPGTRLWAARYNGPGNGDDYPRRVVVSPDGSKAYVTGWSMGATSGLDYTTAAYNAATGARLWTARYNGPANGNDTASAVVVSPDGKTVYVTGTSPGGATTYNDFATIAYSAATGAEKWAVRYNSPDNRSEGAAALTISPDGSRLFVTGTGDEWAWETVAYNAATGVQQWVAQYNGSGQQDWAAAVAASPDGKRVYVAGGVEESCSGCGKYATVAYNAATGSQLWVKQYDNVGIDNVRALALSPDGTRVYVTGHSDNKTQSTADYVTIAYNAVTGARLWLQRYNGPAQRIDEAFSMAVSPAGTVVVTGASQGRTSSFDYATIAYSPGGTQLWVKRYNGPGNRNDTAYSVAVPGNGKVYVTGSSQGKTSGSDYATVAYNIFTGATQWIQRYNGPGNGRDEAFSVAARGGRVFVTGDSPGTNSGSDWATVAYNG